MRFFASGFFHESSSSRPLNTTKGLFRLFQKFAETFTSQGISTVSRHIETSKWCYGVNPSDATNKRSAFLLLLTLWKVFRCWFLTQNRANNTQLLFLSLYSNLLLSLEKRYKVFLHPWIFTARCPRAKMLARCHTCSISICVGGMHALWGLKQKQLGLRGLMRASVACARR